MAATISVSTMINGEPQFASVTLDEEGALHLKPAIPAGQAATDWTKVGADAGLAVLAAGHALAAGDKVTVFWPAGRRYDMLARTNNYRLQADLTFFNATTELGFAGRVDTDSQTGYVLSLNARDSYFNLIKLDPAEPGGFVNLVNHHLFGLSFTPDDSYRISFSIFGARLHGRLHSSSGELLDEIDCTDDSYPVGDIATWAWRSAPDGSIAGRWDNLAMGDVAFPEMTAYPQAPQTFIQSPDGRSLEVADPSGQFPLTAGVVELDVENALHARLSGGAGEELPNAAASLTLGKQIDVNAGFDPDDLIVLLASADRRASILFKDAEDNVLLPLDLAAGGFSLWFQGSGLDRPMTGNAVAKVTVANGSTSAGTVKVSAMYDPTP